MFAKQIRGGLGQPQLRTATGAELVHKLLLMRVRPYYLYQCDPISGSAHFRTPGAVRAGLGEALDAAEALADAFVRPERTIKVGVEFVGR